MKKFLVVSTLVLLVASIASASALFTALPSGKGEMGAAISGAQTSNWGQVSDATSTAIGASFTYGLTDSLDLYLGYKTMQSSKLTTPSPYLPFIPTLAPVALDNTGNQIGGILKYTLINELKGAPLSLALGLGISAVNTKTTGTVPAAPAIGQPELKIDLTSNGNVTGLGLVVSKLFIPFVPYGAVQYMMGKGDFDWTEVDLTVGTALAFSRNWAILAEYNSQSTTPNGGSSYTSNQIALEVSWSK